MGTIATMTNGSITVTGAGLAALYSDTDGVTNVTNVKITTMGDNTYGAFAEATNPVGVPISPGGGTINITGGSITTQGMGAFGVFAQGQPSIPSIITLNNSMLTTTVVAPWATAPTAPPSAPRIPPPRPPSGGARWDAEQRRYGYD